ncbi:MAG TPA: hypothetical protein VF916_00210, partial [Ktedonobacterales bacterium]
MQHVKAAWATAIRVAVLGILHISTRLIAQVEVHGLEHDAGAPRTYLAISHKRDLDAMAPLTPILLHRGWRALAHDLHFAMRSDGFTPGFLARMVGRPRWLAHLLRPLSVGKVLRALGIHPIQDLRLRPGEEWIRDVLREEGDPPAGDVLTTEFLAQVAASAHEPRTRLERSRLSELLRWRYQAALQPYMGAEILVPGARRRADQRTLALAKGYLSELAEWLWQDGSVYSSPEGRLSPDGRLSPITSGFHRVLRAAPPETQVAPIFVMYDFITTARPRIFVDLAPAIPHAPELPRAALDERLHQAWLGSARFTCTQLATGFLVRASRQSAAPFTLAELTDH